MFRPQLGDCPQFAKAWSKSPFFKRLSLIVPQMLLMFLLGLFGLAKSIMPGPFGYHSPAVPFHHDPVRLPVTLALDVDRFALGTTWTDPPGGVQSNCNA